MTTYWLYKDVKKLPRLAKVRGRVWTFIGGHWVRWSMTKDFGTKFLRQTGKLITREEAILFMVSL
jgi:hypothetical protein